MRRGLVWLVTVPLAVLGSELAQVAVNALYGAPAGKGGEFFQGGGFGANEAPLLVAIVFAIALATLVGRAVGFWWSPRDATVARLPFACLAPVLFIVQEHVELAVHNGGEPFSAAVEPSFIPGLLLQLPFALAAYLIARAVLRAADVVNAHLAVLLPTPFLVLPELRHGWSPPEAPRVFRLARVLSGRAPPRAGVLAPS